MKRTLIALALTALPVAALAEVNMYGNIRAGYEGSSTKTDNTEINIGGTSYKVDNNISGHDDSDSFVNGIADNGSYIGVRGNEGPGSRLAG